ncbi:MAG: ATP-binding protein [Candidatus Limiplasma sp.]|nr:ATP-binding protein [Candidatus Limiplasma sp.]
MTRDQILAQLQQEYMQRREDNLRLFEKRRQEACTRCPGLEELLNARHAAVMQGVRASLLSAKKNENLNLAGAMADLNRRIAERLAAGGLPEDFLQPVYTCARCRDEGYLYNPSRQMCSCMEQELIRRLMAENGLDDRQIFARFNDQLYDGQPDETGVSPRQRAMLNRKVAQRYAEDYPDTQTRDLLIAGKSGLGKTFLLKCIAQRVAQRGYTPTYVSAYRLFETARQAYMENNSALMNPYMDAQLLLIDDLGSEPLMNNVTVTQLFNLLNERQMAGRHTVISTNLNMKELQERYTERIASRLLDETGCARLTFTGSDIRRNAGRKAAD